MIKISRKLTEHDKEQLLNLQNQRRQHYGLKPLKTIHMETFITIPTDKTRHIPQIQTNEGMYQ